MPVPVLTKLISLFVSPVTDLENVTPTSKLFAVWRPCGTVKASVATVVSKLMALEVALLAGAVRVPSDAASLATANVIVPFAAVGDVTVAV